MGDVIDRTLNNMLKKKKYVKDPESCMTDQQVWEERHGHYYDDD